MKKISKIIKIIAFILIFLLVCIAANYILNTNERIYITTATHEADGSDAVFIGTSQGYCGLNPLMVWDQNGIPCFNFCGAGQYIGTTYYVLKDLYRYQIPKVVMLDYESLTRPDDFLTISNKLMSLPMIAGLRNRFDMYKDIIGDHPIYMIPMLRYHNRWKEVSQADFQTHYTILGSMASSHIQDITENLPGGWEKKEDIPIGERELDYLNRIYQETQAHNSELVLLDLPCFSSPDMETKNAAVHQWAKEHNVMVCEANNEGAFQKMQLTAHDFGDLYHMNVNGQEKLSYYVGDWLSRNCSRLTDQRKTDAGKLWEEKMPFYRRYFLAGKLTMETDIKSYFEMLQGGNYTVAISMNGDYRNLTSSEDEANLQQAFAAAGLSMDMLNLGGGYVKSPDGSFLFGSMGEKQYLWYKSLEQSDLVMRGSTYTNAEGKELSKTELIFEQWDHSKVENGINILVYNDDINEMVETVGFDAQNHYSIVR